MSRPEHRMAALTGPGNWLAVALPVTASHHLFCRPGRGAADAQRVDHSPALVDRGGEGRALRVVDMVGRRRRLRPSCLPTLSPRLSD